MEIGRPTADRGCSRTPSWLIPWQKKPGDFWRSSESGLRARHAWQAATKPSFTISGVVDTAATRRTIKSCCHWTTAQLLNNTPDAISRVEISARTKPEDAFARKDPDTLSPKDHEIWYCRPYANSIAYQIREAIPGAQAEQVRRVEQSEGNVLKRISGLMWLISAAALLAAGFAVSAAMATAILERRGEIGLMRSLGASKGAIAFSSTPKPACSPSSLEPSATSPAPASPHGWERESSPAMVAHPNPS